MSSPSDPHIPTGACLVLLGILGLMIPGCLRGSSTAAPPAKPGPPADGPSVPPGEPKVLPSLLFVRHPDGGLAGEPFGGPIAVKVVGEAAGESTVEITLIDPAGTARLGGRRVAETIGGVAVFFDLVVTKAGRRLVLRATATGATDGYSRRFDRAVVGGKRHVILLIADGWGYQQIEATASLEGRQGPYTGFASYAMATWDADVARLNGSQPYDPVRTWNEFSYPLGAATDSASSATAMYTGTKTNGGRVGVGPDRGGAAQQGRRLVAIGELAGRNGLGSGLVSSVPISHATPAAWATHNDSRYNYHAIADEMLFGDPAATSTGAGAHGLSEFIPQVAIGGGHPGSSSFFVSQAQVLKAKRQSRNPDGWRVVERQSGQAGGRRLLQAAADPAVHRLLGLFGTAAGNIAFRNHDGSGLDPQDPTLGEMTRAALAVLSRRPGGFVLMVEGGAVDWAGHGNSMTQMIGEMIGFHEAVEEVVSWVEDSTNDSHWGNTLVVITGDHETGYLTAGPGVFPDQPLGRVTNDRIAGEKFDFANNVTASWDDVDGDQRIDPGEEVYWAWNTGGHSNSLVPCYFRGLASDRFARYAVGVDPKRGRFIDNTDIYKVMLELLRGGW